MRVVTRRTGLTAELLRAWERRHEVVQPARSAGGRRLYSDADIERLRLLYQSTRAGRGIGQVAALSNDALAELVRRDVAADAEASRSREGARGQTDQVPSAAAYYAKCARALEQVDLPRLSTALWRATVALPAATLFDAVLLPLLDGAGLEPSKATLRPLHRHLAMIGVRRLLDTVIERAGQSPATATIVVAAPAGLRDEAGAMVIGALAATDGWRVTYLGADVLAEDIAEAAVRTRALGVVLGLAEQTDAAVLNQIRQLRRGLPSQMAVMVGGRASTVHRAVLDEIGVRRFHNLAECRAQLSAFRHGRRRTNSTGLNAAKTASHGTFEGGTGSDQ